MASSSSSTRNWKNIVFISFHGKDSRYAFLSHLYKGLREKGIKTFKDDTELERGEEIEPGLEEAIESSMISIIIFTQNYASSTYCLDELVKILEYKEQGQMVVPIFLYVDPSDVANPTAGVYAEAFCSHRHNVKVETWKAAMTRVANLSGFDHKNFSSESRLVDAIATHILKKLAEQTAYGYAHGYVGIDSQIEKIQRLLFTDSTLNPVRFIGIVGMGGIGKTTLVRVLYEQFSREFDTCSFLSVGEISGGTVGLIQRLLSELFRDEKIVMNTTFISNSSYATRLRNLKVLVVLDNVDGLKEWEDLIGGTGTSVFGLGSRIIITSRDKGQLKTICNDDHILEVEKLSPSDASKLFCRHAFKEECPNEEFKDVLGSFLDFASGNPMALKVLGSYLHGKSESNWLSALDRMRKELHSDIYEMLKISFDGLKKNEQLIFLHIACFFVEGDRWSVMINVLNSCGLFTEDGLSVLKEKCLLEDDRYGSGFRMHDLLREMGRLIVRQQTDKRTILDPKDMQQVFGNDSVSEEVEEIALNMKDFTHDYCSLIKAFAKMPNLKFLKCTYFNYIYCHFWATTQFDKLQIPYGLDYLSHKLCLLHWELCPLKQLPAQFLPGNLVQLKMPHSKLERLWEEIQYLQKLKELDLSGCSQLIELPDLSAASNVEYIDLSGCESLVQIPLSWSHLNNLLFLSLQNCTNIRNLPEKISWKSLETLDLNGMSELECFPEIECLDGLKEMSITECYNLKSIPSSILKLKALEKLDLRGCLNLSAIGEHAYSHSDFHWSSLREINATNCFSLRTLPDLERMCTFKPRQNGGNRRRYTKQNGLDKFYFTNCLAIEEGTWNRMVALAKAKIQSTATYSYFQGEDFKFVMICPGCEIPEWIKHQNMGNSITIQVPIHKRFIGFALSAVLPTGAYSFDFDLHFKDASGIKFDLETIKKESDDHFSISRLPYFATEDHLSSEHLFLTYTPFVNYDRVIQRLGATDEYYEITFEMSVMCVGLGTVPDMDVIVCGVVPLYAQSVNEKLETPQSEATQVTINNDLEVYVDKHQVENPDRLIISRTCQEGRLSKADRSTPSAHLGTLYYIMGDERCKNVSILSWLSDERCLECKSYNEDEPRIIWCPTGSRKKCMEHDVFCFGNCFAVDWHEIVALAKMRIQAMAMCSYFQDKFYNFVMIYPGHEIPKWIKDQNTGNSITIKLPVNNRFLGFALAVVDSAGNPDYECKLQFRNTLGDSFDWKPSTFCEFHDDLVDSHVILIYSSFREYEYDRLVKKLDCVGDCYEVSCEFCDSFGTVIMCGMVPLYGRIPKNEGLERPLDETTSVIVKLVEEKLEIFVDGYRLKNSKASIVLETFKEADIKLPQVELSASTPPSDELNCTWGVEAHINFDSLRQGEAQINEFNQKPQGTEQNDEFLQRISRIPTSRFYERYIKNGFLHWGRYPMKRLPAYIHPADLVHLNLTCSKVEQLWEGKQDLKNLKILDLSDSRIVKLPDLSLATNIENINLSRCNGLVEIPFSASRLNKLQSLDLRWCTNLTSLPSSISWKSLKRLYLSGCSKLECFPKIECLDALDELLMYGCDNLKSIPDSIWKLKSLSEFNLGGSSLEKLSEIRECPLSSIFQLEKPIIGRSYRVSWEYDDYFNFSGSSNVDGVILRQILSLTKMRIQVVAVHSYFQNMEYISNIVYRRCEIPEWIKHQNEGSSITIRLPTDKKFIGLALAVLLRAGCVWFDFELHFRNASDDCSFGSFWFRGWNRRLLDSEHVFILTHIPKGHNSIYNEIVERLKSIGENFHIKFLVDEKQKKQDVIKCGIVPLYTQNAKCKELEKRPNETTMVTVRRRIDDRLEAFVDGCGVESPNQEVISETCKEAGIEISEVETYLEPIMPYKHLGTMYCVWGNERCIDGCTVCQPT